MGRKPEWTLVEQGDGIKYPQFHGHLRKENTAAFYNIGENKSVFEDKVAVSPVGQYTEADKQGWVRTTANYLVSKAFEMAALLLWAESAQAHPISHEHVHALGECGFMSSVGPIQLSRDLWGYLNLALTGKQKQAFNNSPQGHGFEAWRRLVVLIMPRSEACLRDVQWQDKCPPKSKKLSDVVKDTDQWEAQLFNDYKRGGDHMFERTQIVCLRMLPARTPSSLKIALKGISEFEIFK